MKHSFLDQLHEETRWSDRMAKIDLRERAARALCRRAGDPENIKFYGKPMWMTYLPEVDAVLKAVGWHNEMRGAGAGGQSPPITEAVKYLARVLRLTVFRI